MLVIKELLFVACGSKRERLWKLLNKPIRYMSLVVIRISMVALHLPDIPGVRFRKTVSVCGKKGVRMNAVDDAEKVLFLVFSPILTSGTVLSEEEMSERDLLSAVVPLGGYA